MVSFECDIFSGSLPQNHTRYRLFEARETVSFRNYVLFRHFRRSKTGPDI
jgi:hypothetical protein